MKGYPVLLKILLLTLSGYGLSACATAPPKVTELEFLQDVSISSSSGPATKIKRGQKVPAGDKPVLVEAPGFVSVLVLPTAPYRMPAQVQLKLKKDDLANSGRCDAVQDVRVQEVLPEVEKIQNYIAQSQPKSALSRLDELQRRYPKITFLNFLRASILVLMGDQAQARAVLEIALKEFPKNESGAELYKTITGGAPK